MYRSVILQCLKATGEVTRVQFGITESHLARVIQGIQP